jgi:hypothetical protein
MNSGSVYTSLMDIERDTVNGKFKTEAELRQAFIEALKSEFPKHGCRQDVVKFALSLLLERSMKDRKRPDIRFSNVIIEVEPPKAGLAKGRDQLLQYMKALIMQLRESGVREFEIYGIVTDGIDAEFYKLHIYSNSPTLIKAGKLSETMMYFLRVFCAEKIPIISSEELVEILGV